MELHHDLYNKGKKVGAAGNDYLVSIETDIFENMR